MRADKAGVGTSEPLTDVIWRNVQSGWSFDFDHPSVEVDISMWWRQGFRPISSPGRALIVPSQPQPIPVASMIKGKQI